MVPIGRVVATELLPATPHHFRFWTATDAAVGIGALVRVEGEGGETTGGAGRVVYGVITDAIAYTDQAPPLTVANVLLAVFWLKLPIQS